MPRLSHKLYREIKHTIGTTKCWHACGLLDQPTKLVPPWVGARRKRWRRRKLKRRCFKGNLAGIDCIQEAIFQYMTTKDYSGCVHDTCSVRVVRTFTLRKFVPKKAHCNFMWLLGNARGVDGTGIICFRKFTEFLDTRGYSSMRLISGALYHY